MKTEEKLGSVKRFGVRYGRKLKLKFSKIETEQRKLHKCPYCSKISVKRVAVGIWRCKKCDAKFTGKAYSVARRILLKGAGEYEEEAQELAKEAADPEEASEEA